MQQPAFKNLSSAYRITYRQLTTNIVQNGIGNPDGVGMLKSAHDRVGTGSSRSAVQGQTAARRDCIPELTVPGPAEAATCSRLHALMCPQVSHKVRRWRVRTAFLSERLVPAGPVQRSDGSYIYRAHQVSAVSVFSSDLPGT